MAKIKKTTLDAGGTDSCNRVIEDADCKTTQAELDHAPVKEVIDFKQKYIDKDVQNKLDSYNDLEEQNAMLLKEKNDLEAKIAEYIEKNASLKSASETTNGKNDEEIVSLKNELDLLKQSIAQYLRRISDLTFENANLTAQLKELSQNSAQVQNTIPSMPVQQTKLEKPFYNPYKQNGYSSWN